MRFVSVLTAAIAGFVACTAASQESSAARDATVSSVPSAVYKVADPGNAGTESWFFDLVVHVPDQAPADVSVREAVLEVFAADTLRERTLLPSGTLTSLLRRSYTVDAETPLLSLRRLFTLPETFDLPLAFRSRPVSWNTDRVRVSLELETAAAGTRTETLDVPVARFQQRTELLFPIAGPAIVTQGPINNAGHSGHANQFAVDVMGLNDSWGPIEPGRTGNEVFAGWGREVRAPAAGRVVYARNDVPDNPAEGGDPSQVYGDLADPILATAGNAVVIDHGNGEFSVLMHMRQGSVPVAAGDSVQAGDVVGRIGNSGDSFGAHLHYQLQDGPELFRASSLPAAFANLGRTRLFRGVFFEATPPGGSG